MNKPRLLAALSVLAASGIGNVAVAESTINLLHDGNVVHVTLDNKLFTRYHAAPNADPILWPVIGPTGAEMTRGYPMREGVPDEKTDHPHHRSLWFSHGDVNGIDFWTDPGDENRNKRGFGRIVHREFMCVDDEGESPTIMTKNDWINFEDEIILSDIRTVCFGSSEDARWIDFDIQLFNVGDQAVKIGDTKEGTFGIRVPQWMKVDNGGQIVNNLGSKDKEVWGAEASWVDYHGEYENETLGVAILNHPSSFRFPSYWHVRTYGLFAANVFGLHNFKNSDEVDGSHELLPGESLMFCYRVLLHRGDEQKGRIPEAFIEYAKVDKPKLTLEELTAKATAAASPRPDGETPPTEAVEVP